MRPERPTAAPTAEASSGPAWSLPGLREPSYSQSLERGLAILRCFTPAQPLLGIAQLADELEMSRSTVHRYAITLVALGYLEQDSSRKYRLGLRVSDLGMSALSSTGLREHAHSHLQELRQRTGYTASLAILSGREILYIDRLRSFRCEESEHELELGPGSRLPAHCTAKGKILLAHRPEREQRELLAGVTPAKRTANTITGKKALLVELLRVLEEGFAVNDQELAAGLHAIAVPVRNESREVVAAVSLAAQASRISLEEFADALAAHLISTADRISARLGYRREDEIATGSSTPQSRAPRPSV